QLPQCEVAAEVAEVVVDRLEKVDVEEDEGQRPLVPGRSGQLAVDELEQVALVVDLRQAVDDRQPINLFVILRFDVAAREEAVNAVADAEVVAVREAGGVDL